MKNEFYKFITIEKLSKGYALRFTRYKTNELCYESKELHWTFLIKVTL